MRKQIQNYISRIEKILHGDTYVERSSEEWKTLYQRHLDKIAEFQHERLVHLLVTLTFALVEFLCIGFVLETQNVVYMILSGLVLILLIPYILHYFFLENSVQYLYQLSDEIAGKIIMK